MSEKLPYFLVLLNHLPHHIINIKPPTLKPLTHNNTITTTKTITTIITTTITITHQHHQQDPPH